MPRRDAGGRRCRAGEETARRSDRHRRGRSSSALPSRYFAMRKPASRAAPSPREAGRRADADDRRPSIAATIHRARPRHDRDDVDRAVRSIRRRSTKKCAKRMAAEKARLEQLRAHAEPAADRRPRVLPPAPPPQQVATQTVAPPPVVENRPAPAPQPPPAPAPQPVAETRPAPQPEAAAHAGRRSRSAQARRRPHARAHDASGAGARIRPSRACSACRDR